MKIVVELDVSRTDGRPLNDDQREDVLGQVESAIPDISLDDIVTNEGKANEDSVALEVSVVSIEERRKK